MLRLLVLLSAALAEGFLTKAPAERHTIFAASPKDPPSQSKRDAFFEFASSYMPSELENMLPGQLPAGTKEYMSCSDPVYKKSFSFHYMFTFYLIRYPTLDEYKQFFDRPCQWKRGETMESAQEYVLREFEKKMGVGESTSMANKTAVVTGGSRAIGFALAVLMARRGADVLVVSRSRDWFDWTKSAAMGDNSIWTAPTPVTENLTKAAETWNATWTDDADVPEPLKFAANVHAGISSVRYKLPQTKLPFYYGLTGIASSVFEKITHEVCDIRSRSNLKNVLLPAMDEHLGQGRTPDYVFYNAMAEGSMSSPSTPVGAGTHYSGQLDGLDLFDFEYKDSVEEVIAATPHIRDNIRGKATSNLDFEIGTGALMYELRAKYGDSIRTQTMHILSASMAAMFPMEHEIRRNESTSDLMSARMSFPSGLYPGRDSSYIPHYALAKLRSVEFANAMHEDGWNIFAAMIGATNGMVNYQWIHNTWNHWEPFTHPYTWDHMPMRIDKVDSTGARNPNGHFVSGMSAAEYQKYASFASALPNANFVPSGWSAAIRMLAIADKRQQEPYPACAPSTLLLESPADGLLANTYTYLRLMDREYVPAFAYRANFTDVSSATATNILNTWLLPGQSAYRQLYRSCEPDGMIPYDRAYLEK